MFRRGGGGGWDGWGRLRRPLVGRRDETQRATQASPPHIRSTPAPTDVYPDYFFKDHYHARRRLQCQKLCSIKSGMRTLCVRYPVNPPSYISTAILCMK